MALAGLLLGFASGVGLGAMRGAYESLRETATSRSRRKTDERRFEDKAYRAAPPPAPSLEADRNERSGSVPALCVGDTPGPSGQDVDGEGRRYARHQLKSGSRRAARQSRRCLPSPMSEQPMGPACARAGSSPCAAADGKTAGAALAAQHNDLPSAGHRRCSYARGLPAPDSATWPIGRGTACPSNAAEQQTPDRRNPRQPARIPRGGSRTHRKPFAPPLFLDPCPPNKTMPISSLRHLTAF